MKNSITVTTALLFVFLGVSCKNADSTATLSHPVKTTVPLPNTPEDVVKTWENQVAQNKFDEAKLISTGKILETVVSLDSTNHIENMPPSYSKVLDIACVTEGDKAQCNCLLQDAYGQLKWVYDLVRQDGQWYLQNADPAETPKETVKSTVNKKPERTIK